MAKKFEVLSHAQRLMDDSLVCRREVVPYDPTYRMYRVTQIVENGVVVKKSQLVTVDNAEEMSRYKASDFKLDNIVAAGAYDMLKPQSFMPDALADADHMDSVMDNIDAYVMQNNVMGDNQTEV